MRWLPDDSRGRLGALVIFAAAQSACILADGQPWGELADARVSLAFLPTSERLDPEGRLKTAQSYVVAVEELSATVSTVAVLQTDPSSAPLSFDPADPPAGYSLCHGGHCHADDGRLVPFAEVERELNGGGTDAPTLFIDIGADVALATLPHAPVALPAACPPGACVLARGPIVATELAVTDLRVRGTAFDTLADARLPAEGAAFDVVVSLVEPLGAPLAAEAERFAPVRWVLDARFAVPASFLDDADFASPTDTDAEAIAARILEDANAEASLVPAPHDRGDTP